MNRTKKTDRKRRNGKSSRRESWEDRESRDERRDNKRRIKETSTNDERWYSTDPALLRDSAHINFSWPLGQNVQEGVYLDSLGVDDRRVKKSSIPGIMALFLSPTFGAGTDSDAINVAAAQIYSFIRHANSGSRVYDPNDLMLYIMAMTEVYSYINFLERTYALATMYDQENRYMPEALLAIQGINPKSIAQNLADFRYYINVLINKVSSIAVPATMTLFERHAMLYAHVYSEGQNTKDQMYMYVPHGFHRFALDGDEAGQLEYVPLPWASAAWNGSATAATWQDLIDYGTAMFNAIWEQEDFGIMSGDVLKAYGSAILKLTSLDEVLPYGPKYDPLVLHQIKNASVGCAYIDNTFDVYQNDAKSKLLCTPTMSGANKALFAMQEIVAKYNKIMTLDTGNPTNGMIMEASRLMVGCHNVKTSDMTIEPICGSEVVRWCVVAETAAVDDDNRMRTVALDHPILGMYGNTSIIHTLSAAKAFKYSPNLMSIYFDSHTDPTAINNIYHFREVDNFGVITNADIEKLHTAAILNLLNVPSTAKANMQ